MAHIYNFDLDIWYREWFANAVPERGDCGMLEHNVSEKVLFKKNNLFEH